MSDGGDGDGLLAGPDVDEGDRPDTFGEERHPSVSSSRPGDYYISSNNPLLHRCDGDGGVEWVVGLPVDEIPDAIIDADRSGGEVSVHVTGTRKGDTVAEMCPVDDIRAGDGGAVIVFRFPPGEIGTLYRWWATGCLACRNGGGWR